MKSLALSILCFWSFALLAQQNSLKVGNRIFINNCSAQKTEYNGIEIYSRTDLFDKTNTDSLTGKGISKAFFNTKSLDGKRLPCSMGGRYYTIAAIDKYTEKNVTHTIVLLYDYYPLNMLLVDYENAMFNNEIKLVDTKKPNIHK
jgi:hypothetical protein